MGLFQKLQDGFKNWKIKKENPLAIHFFRDGFQFIRLLNGVSESFNDTFIFDVSKQRESIDYINKHTIKRITVNNSFSKPIQSLDFLDSIRHVESLTILQGNLDLSPVTCLKELRHLSFEKPKKILDLKHFEKLEYLGADCHSVKNISLCKNLKSLHLANYHFDDFNELSSLIKLEKVFIDKSTSTSLNGLKGLIDLEILELHHCNKLKSLEGLPIPSKLKKLFIYKADELTDYTIISQFHELQKLQLVSGGHLENLDVFRGLKNLTYLQLGMEVLSEDKMLFMEEVQCRT